MTNRYQVCSRAVFALLLCAYLLSDLGLGVAAEPVSFDEIAAKYTGSVRPLLKRYCLECHNDEEQEGELNLQRFASLAEVRRDPRVW